MINVTKLSRRRQREQKPPASPQLIVEPLEVILLLIAQQSLGVVGVACVLALIVIIRLLR